ncbi:MAG: hypothetical protein KIT62_17690 [Cyclobacteriaceae bacterium]|nr:hypothetical protein [Cyclobacteriaceae bacterium]
MTTETILLIIVLGLNLIGGLFILHLKKYFSKKGENLADKEDLEELTTIVEEVKTKFEQDTELLRANLAIETNKKNVIFNEQKQSIIDYSTHLNIWLWDSLRIAVHEYNHTNHEELKDKIIKIRESYNNVNVSLSKVQLLVPSETLVKSCHETLMEVLKVHGFVDIRVSRLKRVLSYEKVLVDQFISRGEKIKPGDLSFKFYEQQAKDNADEKKAVLDDYIEEHGKLFSSAVQKRNEFLALAKHYLNM